MTKLRTERVSYLRVDNNDLEQYIIETLGVREDFSVSALLEAGNDSQHKIYPTKMQRNDDQYNEVVFWKADPNGIPAPPLYVIMGYLITNGLIPDDVYMVDISW